jgi:general secretion pathway protein F
MPDYVWKAARADASTLEGRLSAPTQARAMQQLRSQGLTLLSIQEAGAAAAADPAGKFKSLHGGEPSRLSRLLSNQNVTQADILVMSSELSIMLKAGLALDNALRVLIGMNAKPSMMKLTQTLLEDVKGGVSLSKALGKHPQQFSDFYINMIRSGEASGQISAVLERLVEHLERLKALRESVISAIIYPCILLGVAVISLVAMLGFVVPQFETLFNDMGDALPAPTRLHRIRAHHGGRVVRTVLAGAPLDAIARRTAVDSGQSPANPLAGPTRPQIQPHLVHPRLWHLAGQRRPLVDRLAHRHPNRGQCQFT